MKCPPQIRPLKDDEFFTRSAAAKTQQRAKQGSSPLSSCPLTARWYRTTSQQERAPLLVSPVHVRRDSEPFRGRGRVRARRAIFWSSVKRGKGRATALVPCTRASRRLSKRVIDVFFFPGTGPVDRVPRGRGGTHGAHQTSTRGHVQGSHRAAHIHLPLRGGGGESVRCPLSRCMKPSCSARLKDAPSTLMPRRKTQLCSRTRAPLLPTFVGQ